jgi:uncharacterized membrane protein
MNVAVAFYLLVLAMSGAVMLLLPDISPRRYFFAITVPSGFRTSEPGRASLRRYYWAVCVALVAAAAVIFNLGQPAAFVFGPMIPVVAGLVSFLRERAVVRRTAPPQPLTHEADLSAANHLPGWVLLALPAFALPLAAAGWLFAHWDEIPARFTIHWNAAGVADRWADKTPRNVYGVLVYGCGMMLFLLLMSLVMFYGSRRSEVRAAMLKMLLATVWLMAILFSGIGLAPIAQFPPWWFFAPVPVFVIAMLVWSLRLARLPADPTPDNAWILGSLYYNPHDAAIFVQKRIGLGYTFNFGNRFTWIVVATMLAILIGLIWVLPR